MYIQEVFSSERKSSDVVVKTTNVNLSCFCFAVSMVALKNTKTEFRT